MADSAFAEIARSDDRGAKRWQIPATSHTARLGRSLNSRDSKVDRHVWLFRRGSEFDFLPTRESMIVREPSGVHFSEIEVSGIAAFESQRTPKSKSLP
jgi:hypothetical protein